MAHSVLSTQHSVLDIEEVTTTEALEQLRPEWSDLWVRCPAATPFQAPEWLIPWWRHIAEGDLLTLALRHDGRLVGIAPLYIYTRPGSLVREVFLIGIATTDYLDALFDRGFERSGAAAVFAHLAAICHRWDVCELQGLRPGSPLLEAAIPAGWSDETTACDVCPVLQLPPGEHRGDGVPATTGRFDTLSGYVPRHLLDNLRYYWRRAEKIGPVQVERAIHDNLDELFDRLLQLHHARWSTRGLAGVLADEAVQRSHREALPALLALGVLRLYGLRIGDRLVASFYGLTDVNRARKQAYYYLGGFDPELARLSLGTLIIGHAVAEAIREGAEAFHFLRGRETYKYLWGAEDTSTYRRHLRHPTAQPSTEY